MLITSEHGAIELLNLKRGMALVHSLLFWKWKKLMPTFKQVATITGEDQWTDSVKMIGNFNVSVSGTWNNSIVTTQRQFDEDGEWFDVETFEENVEIVGQEPEKGVLYRIGVKTGDYGTGTISVRLSR